MPTTARRLIGREDELAAIDAFLDAREQLPGAAVLHGQAGIGKTSVWLAGLAAAAEGGYRVLSCRPSEAETRLSYAGLSDVLAGAAGDILPNLPPIQRDALEAALLLGESDARVDERAVGAAFLGTMRLMAADTPMCLAVDDVQWLDAESLAAFRFALPRLDDEPVAVLLAVRGDPPPWLRRTGAGTSLRAVEIGGLSVGAVYELLQTRLGATFARPTLIRLWETSAGNPLFALELASALQRRGGTHAPGDPLPIPATLEELLRERLEGVSADALEVARVVATVAEPTTDLVEAAAGARSDSGLSEALDSGILELDGNRLRFSHPLLGSAVVARQTPSRRRSLHARLAAIVPSVEERARHLALATTKPSHQTAAILEDAARSAQVRGAPVAAAELAEQALRLTPRGDVGGARRRLLLAADRHHVAGDTDRAVMLLTQARASAAPGAERIAILVQLGDVLSDALPREAEALYTQALAEVEDDDALDATVHLRIADSMRWGGGIEPGVAHATLAVEAASRTDDLVLNCSAVASLADWRFRAGRGISDVEMEKALALERQLPEWPIVGGPAEYFCHQLVWVVDLDPARRLLLEIRDVRRNRREAGDEAWALWNLGMLEWRAGHWEQADQYAARAVELLTQLGRLMPPEELPAAVIAAHRGRIAEARARAVGAVARAEAEGIQIGQSGHGWVLGFIELSLGKPAAALGQLRRSYELRNTFMREPGMRIELGDLLEALIATGELDEAEAILPVWEMRARMLDRAWSLAVLHRCRGLLLAARGDLDTAFTRFDRALAEHDRDVDPFSRARTLLALGRTQRRAKRRGAARTTLEDALTRFETLGATLWAEQTRAELARIGGRASSGDELTESERRIAQLVTEGRTNREVAAALFLTERSVETALTRIYRKLGVRSRGELAHLLRANT